MSIEEKQVNYFTPFKLQFQISSNCIMNEKISVCACNQTTSSSHSSNNLIHLNEKAVISVEKSLKLVLEWRSLLKARQGSAFYLNNDRFENSNVTKAVLLKKERVIKTTTSLCNEQPPTTRDFGVYTRNKKKTTCHQTSISNHLGTWLQKWEGQ